MIDIRAAWEQPNVKAFSHVVREGETNQTPTAYSEINGGAFFNDFSRHPFEGKSTFFGGKAAGAYQFLPSTWGELAKQYELPDFSPQSQEYGYVGCLVKRNALDDVIAGRFEQAIAKCRKEWTSLPGASENSGRYTMAKAKKVYETYGGTYEQAVETQPAAPVEEQSTQWHGVPDNSNSVFNQSQSTTTQEEKPMGALALLQLFAPMLANLIPQITPLLHPKDADNVQKYGNIAETVVNTILTATGQPNMQAAVEAMQRDKTMQQNAQQAVVSHPEILPFIEVGGGFAAARDADLKVMTSSVPFWKTSAVFWISMLLYPLAFWYVGSTIVGGTEIPADWPWIAQFALKLFGGSWSEGSRSGIANLVLGLVLGGICGVYFGVSVTQQKQQAGTDTSKG